MGKVIMAPSGYYVIGLDDSLPDFNQKKLYLGYWLFNHDSLPDELRKYTKLKELKFNTVGGWSCGMYECIPSYMSQREFDLPVWFQEYNHLKKISLEGANLKNDSVSISTLTGMNHLRKLVFSDIRPSAFNIQALIGMKKLSSLELGKTVFSCKNDPLIALLKKRFGQKNFNYYYHYLPELATDQEKKDRKTRW